MPTIEVWVALGEDGSWGVADHEDAVIDNLKNGSSEDLTGTICRLVKLNVTMSEPRYRDDEDDDKDEPVDVTVHADAGRIVEIETE